METLKNLTLVQWIGIMVGLNSLLMGATPQLTVLFGTAAVPYIIAVATLGNGALGVFVTVIGGQSSQVKNVLAMPGVERIAVNSQANAALATIATDPSQNKIAATPAAAATVAATAAKAAAVLFIAIAISLFAFPDAARAAQFVKPTGNLPADLAAATQQVKSAVTGEPAPAPDAALKCTFQMLIKLTPLNLLPTINSCIAGKLVIDTQRALDSATKFGSTGKGDADAINCLTPALAIFQAGVSVPAVPDKPAVLNPDGSVATPAVAGIAAQDPGPILLFQKYREFTLSGALTSCQAWFNAPINATAAAGLGAAATAVGAAAILSPIK